MPRPSSRPRLAALALLAALAACSDSLVDHRADPAVLHPPCGAGETRCGDRCVAEDARHCGDACADCAAGSPPPANASAVCTEQRACAFECAPGWLLHGGACERAAAVSAGFAHACALTSGGGVKCWGSNDHGQLGDGTTTDRSRPVDVVLPAPATAVGVGFFHTCAAAGGKVYCWGDNATGSLGDGSHVPSPSPVLVPGVTGTVELGAGGGRTGGTTVFDYGHSCARDAQGAIRCWGGNESGQLGNGKFEDAGNAVPQPAVALPGPASALAVGDRHTCAVVAGQVLCWGADSSGQAGNGEPRANVDLPVVALASGATAVAAGAAHTCAIAPAAGGSGVLCWGANLEGQADGGTNLEAAYTAPHAVSLGDIPAPALVSAGRAHTCVLAPGVQDGATCFGANDSGQLGVAPGSFNRGIGRPALPPAAQIVSGYRHNCALLADGGVVCFGANDLGQLGRGATVSASEVPAPVSGR
ncbi:MAG: hypothetical protein QM704_10725 [Anaeromyxobacteraceae bacterium]